MWQNKQKPKHSIHIPVLLDEVLNILTEHIVSLKKNNLFSSDKNYLIFDFTLGDGGHSYAIKNMLQDKFPKIQFKLYSFDWDKMSIDFVTKKFDVKGIYWCDMKCDNFSYTKGSKIQGQGNKNVEWYLVHSNFAWVYNFIQNLTANNILFALADLGISSRQLLIKNRGFSFKENKNLADMRMSREFMQVHAYDLLNGLSAKELRDLFVKNIGLSKHIAIYIANEIVKVRQQKPFGFDDDIYRLNLIAEKLKKRGIRKFNSSKLHPATLILLGLRMAVNSERRNLFEMLEGVSKIATKSLKLAIIGFHSVEWDLLETLPQLYGFRLLKIQTPAEKELKLNPRSRSAKLFIYSYE